MSWFGPERLRVGITGHRLNQLPEAAHPAIRAELAASLKMVSQAAREAGHGHARLLLVSALAEGADRIAAHAALEMGWKLVCPLPFKRARYEEDFPDTVAEFRALYARATRRHEIDGEALGGSQGYAAVGREIVRESDLLVAVWNGLPPKGPGGTAEVCALALEKGSPVIWIGPEGGRASMIPPEGRPARPRSFRARLAAALAQRFQVIVRPEAMRVA